MGRRSRVIRLQARAWLKGKGDGRSPPWVPACLLLSLAFLGERP